MFKRLLLAAAALVALVAIAAPAGSNAATRGGCKLDGKAKVTPGLTTKTKAISYTFSGSLSSCQGTGKVKSGTITASGSGTGSCSGNTTTGSATITWNTGQTSAVKFSTKGTGPYVAVTGRITSGLFAGSTANANLLFYTATPQACTTAGGLTSPSFTGVAHIGF
jgi:hypothetical protein